MIPGNANPLLLATAAADGAAATGVATKSLRFNSGDTAYLSRSQSSGNSKTFTYAFWFKAPVSGYWPCIIGADSSSDERAHFRWNGTQLQCYFVSGGSQVLNLQTNRVFRDKSAWHHIVLAFDTTQSTASDRAKLYVNGTQESSFAYSTYPSQNATVPINNSSSTAVIGRRNYDASNYFNGYLADIYFIDGSAIGPTSFGAFDDSGVWQAAAYSGTFGTNGFHLKFDDASSNAALGTDSSGNNNDFTVYNLVASAPATAKGGFDVVTYTGTGSTQSISGLKFQPDFVWIRQRDASRFNVLFDSVRGVNKRLISNNTAAESTQTDHLSAFTSDGFTVQTSANVNVSSGSYVAWAWKAGGTAVSNTNGTITSSVSANTDYGFSIVSYTGTGSNATIGHGLTGQTPKFIIAKTRDSSVNWIIYHASLSSDGFLRFTTATEDNNTTVWNTAPTSSVFGVGSANGVNESGDDYIAYCWSERPGFSSFGSYEGDGDGTGPDVTTGFKPKYVLIKNIDEAAGWRIYDSVRGTSKVLKPNTQDTELSTGDPIVFLSDGFRLTGTSNEETNKSGQTYIYAAFSGEPPGDLVDSLFDAPTNGAQSDTGAGGEVSGCYATLNPLQKGSTQTLSNGNLDFSGSGGHGHTFSTIGMSSGKFYCEYTAGNTYAAVGIALGDSAVINAPIGDNPGSWGYVSNGSSSTKQADPPSSHTSYGSAVVSGDVVGIAFDADNGTLEFYKNGTSMGVAYTGISTGYTYHFIAGDSTSAGTPTGTMNFGARAFAYSAPSGYKALCTTNLPTPTIADGSDYFEAKLYSGTGSSNAVTGLEFSPDLVWIKDRTTANSHNVSDIVRGTNKSLFTNADNAETSGSPNPFLSSFDSNGFTVGGNPDVNTSSNSYVAWCWDAGSSTVSNTDGSITSNVRANTSAGFSIVSYTGNATSGATFGHGLGVEPELVIIKDRDSAYDWIVYHKDTGNTSALRLNGANAKDTDTKWFNDSGPSSTTFTLGNTAGTNASGDDFIAYCFAPVSQYSAFGVYTGNGSSTDGIFVWTGFKPAFLLIKRIDAASSWYIFDSARSTFNVVDDRIQAHSSNAENTNAAWNNDFLSNGFKLRTSETELNNNGSSYIYAAFSENAFSLNGGLAR